MYTLIKATQSDRGTTFAVKEYYHSISSAIAATPGFGWGQYIVTDPNGRRVARVNLAPPLANEDSPIESSTAAVPASPAVMSSVEANGAEKSNVDQGRKSSGARVSGGQRRGGSA